MGFKAGFIGLIGQPNAGKSTLMNLLVKEKVSIVTPKPQTTRRRVLGVVSSEQGQVIFVDAPGVLNASEGLNAFLAQEARDVIDSSDALIAVLSLDEKNREDVAEILALVNESKKPFMVIISKADLVDKKKRLPIIMDMVERTKPGIEVMEFSSKWKEDAAEPIQRIMDWSLKNIPESPAPLYDIELFTPHTLRELTAEIIREKCFEELDKELPYSVAIRISQFDETKPDITKISADILVGKETHKKIVIGKSAAVIKKIGTKARLELEKLLGQKVFLELKVVVREDWQTNKSFMKDLGYISEQKRK